MNQYLRLLQLHKVTRTITICVYRKYVSACNLWLFYTVWFHSLIYTTIFYFTYYFLNQNGNIRFILIAIISCVQAWIYAYSYILEVTVCLYIADLVLDDTQLRSYALAEIEQLLQCHENPWRMIILWCLCQMCL